MISARRCRRKLRRVDGHSRLVSGQGGFAGVAFHTIERMSDEPGPPLFGQDPWPEGPGRIVPDMTAMTAIEIGDPISVFVLVEADNFPFHSWVLR